MVRDYGWHSNKMLGVRQHALWLNYQDRPSMLTRCIRYLSYMGCVGSS